MYPLTRHDVRFPLHGRTFSVHAVLTQIVMRKLECNNQLKAFNIHL